MLHKFLETLISHSRQSKAAATFAMVFDIEIPRQRRHWRAPAKIIAQKRATPQYSNHPSGGKRRESQVASSSFLSPVHLLR
jgi:hypothetical protein